MAVFGVGWGCLSVWVYRDPDEVWALCVAKKKGRDGVEGEEGGLTCLRGQETYSLLSVQQGERVVQLIIQAKLRHSAWVALPWWADRRKLKDAVWKKKRRNEENGRDECLWSWSVIPRLLLSAFLHCTWNVACRFHGKPQHSKEEMPCEIWAPIVFFHPHLPASVVVCLWCRIIQIPASASVPFFPSFLSFFLFFSLLWQWWK